MLSKKEAFRFLERPLDIHTSKHRGFIRSGVIVVAREEIIQQELCPEVLAALIRQQTRNHLSAELSIRVFGCPWTRTGTSTALVCILVGPHQIVLG